MVREWDCPDLITSEEFKIQYLDPLERAVDSFLSAAVYWKESNLITEGELAETHGRFYGGLIVKRRCGSQVRLRL